MANKTKKLTNKKYEKELYNIQVELCKLQEWVQESGQKVVILFEGRDSAGKGGLIKRLMERVSPRVFQLHALPAPTERQKTQMYIQRYMERFPAAGEIAIFDRSWYNRAGVEKVMEFCTEAEHERFLKITPSVEKAMIDDGIILIKYWFEIEKKTQEVRLNKRIEDPRKHWKLSPMDLQAQALWDKYTEAKDTMFAATDTKIAPWHVVKADNKKTARLNCLSHILSMIPYKDIPYDKPKLAKSKESNYKSPKYKYNFVPEKY